MQDYRQLSASHLFHDMIAMHEISVQAIGICLEGRRLDQLRDIIISSGKPLAALHYARTASSTVVHRAVREKVIRLIVEVFQVHIQTSFDCFKQQSAAISLLVIIIVL